MNKVFIVPNPTKDTGLSVTLKIIDKLSSLGMTVYMDAQYNTIHSAVISCEEFPHDAEMLVVVGGDGSVIDASRVAVDSGIPLLGVNLGRVGYLSEVDPNALDILDNLKNESFSVKEKMLLSIFDDSEGECVYAVNDITVSRGGYFGIAEFNLSDSCGNSLDYRADGIVFATPQGSTAYSFSSGGPVVAHDVEGILVTPVCPHSFFNRSVMFNSSEMLSVTNHGAYPMNIAVDGRKLTELMPGGVCHVGCADKKIKMLTFSENSMFTELFKKMNITEGLK